MVREHRSNRTTVFFACHYLVVWCPNYRRKVLVGLMEARLKQSISEGYREHQAEVEEREVML
ncbi:MAG TPA: transposase, partial [Ktedonobacteraceae bacterium]|nr:transposase [Ktedonobacteraceae bacterium]